MSSWSLSPKVVVIGAGVAGASCARALCLSGCEVHVVDKSRGAGGRLATKRLEWLDPQARRRSARLDHGAPAFAAGSADFRQFLATACPPGALAQWRPTLAPGSRPLDSAGPLWLPQPDMPSLCVGLLRDIPTTWSFAVDALRHGPLGWQIEAAGATLPGHFDAVVLALPPAQAAPLLAAHRRDWAQRVSLALMQPCWTLMGVARRPASVLHWDVARPEQGPLAWVMRNDARPGRESSADEVHWVVHARAGWSRQHLEQPADEVQSRMQDALQDWLGEPIDWQHAVVHRWRYALPQATGAVLPQPCWWDDARGLGVCGDFLGGTGVEGAWQSAQALSSSMLRNHVDA
ncbi:MAG: NAD(P)-binding protein [Betaproteobacteria bacterium]|nr:NAD(P)-binding protein [Betaproteobacteria bacterium]